MSLEHEDGISSKMEILIAELKTVQDDYKLFVAALQGSLMSPSLQHSGYSKDL